jgi:hypothetical protein
VDTGFRRYDAVPQHPLSPSGRGDEPLSLPVLVIPAKAGIQWARVGAPKGLHRLLSPRIRAGLDTGVRRYDASGDAENLKTAGGL